MLDPRTLYEYSFSLEETSEGQELQQRLKLFQVFARLYERNRDLLNDILALETNGFSQPKQRRLFNYLQGFVIGQQAYLITNLLGERTQALVQPQQVWTIGRDGHQVLIPIRDKRLSRRHAAIQFYTQEFRIVDLGSTNGTFVNGQRIQHSYTLKDGDRVRLGSMTFSFFVCCDWLHLDTLLPTDLTQLSMRKLPITAPQKPADPLEDGTG